MLGVSDEYEHGNTVLTFHVINVKDISCHNVCGM